VKRTKGRGAYTWGETLVRKKNPRDWYSSGATTCRKLRRKKGIRGAWMEELKADLLIKAQVPVCVEKVRRKKKTTVTF